MKNAAGLKISSTKMGSRTEAQAQLRFMTRIHPDARFLLVKETPTFTFEANGKRIPGLTGKPLYFIAAVAKPKGVR